MYLSHECEWMKVRVGVGCEVVNRQWRLQPTSRLTCPKDIWRPCGGRPPQTASTHPGRSWSEPGNSWSAWRRQKTPPVWFSADLRGQTHPLITTPGMSNRSVRSDRWLFGSPLFKGHSSSFTYSCDFLFLSFTFSTWGPKLKRCRIFSISTLCLCDLLPT